MRIKAINNTLAIYPPLISLSIVLIIIITSAATLKGNCRFQQVHHTTYHITCRGAASEWVREEPSYYKQTVHSSSQVGVSRWWWRWSDQQNTKKRLRDRWRDFAAIKVNKEIIECVLQRAIYLPTIEIIIILIPLHSIILLPWSAERNCDRATIVENKLE